MLNEHISKSIGALSWIHRTSFSMRSCNEDVITIIQIGNISFSVFSLSDFISRQMAWVWLLWLLSQTWITIHIWTPKTERLASTEKLFILPMYSGLLVDQSMALNRKRDDHKDVKTEVIEVFIRLNTRNKLPLSVDIYTSMRGTTYVERNL